MKNYVALLFLLCSISCFCQTHTEKEVLKASADLFKWEVDDKIDSIASILHDQFVVVSSDGSISRKKAYLERLSGGNFKHNAIRIAETTAVVSGNTATVIGKGKFDVTISGNQRISQLSYLEVFVRESSKKPWKMVAIKVSVIN